MFSIVIFVALWVNVFRVSRRTWQGVSADDHEKILLTSKAALWVFLVFQLLPLAVAGFIERAERENTPMQLIYNVFRVSGLLGWIGAIACLIREGLLIRAAIRSAIVPKPQPTAVKCSNCSAMVTVDGPADGIEICPKCMTRLDLAACEPWSAP